MIPTVILTSAVQMEARLGQTPIRVRVGYDPAGQLGIALGPVQSDGTSEPAILLSVALTSRGHLEVSLYRRDDPPTD